MNQSQRAAAERLADDLQRFDGTERESLRDEAAALLRELLAEPQGEPVAWCSLTPSGKIAYFDGKPMVMPGAVGNEVHRTPLYAHPPQQRKPLSDEQIADIVSSFDGTPDWNLHDFARAIEEAVWKNI